jgi:hypothetical protein
MPSGGARTRSGPAPDPRAAARERKSDAGWTTLPGEGFKGRVPTFPLEGELAVEKKLWRVLWKKPQAIMWQRLGQTFQVAAYVRAFIESTEAGAPASLKTSVLRMEDMLGLSMVGMNALRWKISLDELGEQRSSRQVEVEKPASVRRLRAAGE